MTDWQTIDTAPDDWNRPGGQSVVKVKDRNGREFNAKRGYFNNSGWHESGTNREVWPTHWKPLEEQ